MDISLVICCRKPDISEELRENIRSTIFFPSTDNDSLSYEIVVIDNSTNKYNISQAYNEGVRRAEGGILCFMHDDIRYNNQGWGNTVINHFFIHPEYYACAVAGSKYLKRTPSYYNANNRFNLICYNAKNNVKYCDYVSSSQPETIVAFDGLWFCIRHECFNNICFDEKTYGGFHMYDLDIAMQLNLSGFAISNMPNVDVTHKGSQTTNSDFWKQLFLFHNKYKKYLPLKATDIIISPQEEKRIELDALYTALRNILRFRLLFLLREWGVLSTEILEKGIILATLEVIRSHIISSKKNSHE